MNKTGNVYINLEDFQKFILNYIQSDEIHKAFESTVFANDAASELCFQAMQHGLIWGSLLAASQLPKLIYIEEEKK